MIEKRYFHAAVSMGDKMFVVGGFSITSCEVFDSFSRKFTIIKSGIKFRWSDAICIGNNIVVFHNCYEVRT